uniref:Uncharacterized protein n=1 Tax=Rhizophora mucronata TaxID=61149 RepID=A0A2P2PGI2_RHIMU
MAVLIQWKNLPSTYILHVNSHEFHAASKTNQFKLHHTNA